MTVTSTTNRVVGQGNGLTTQFDYSFLIQSQAYLVVTLTDSDGNETVLTTQDYTVTGIDDEDGGQVTYPLSGPAISTGESLTIERVLPLKQLTTMSNQGAFYPQSVEEALDYLMMALQQVNDLYGRGLVVAVSDPDPLPLPAVEQRANQLLGFDADGNPIAAEPSSALVSSAMQPVVAAATLALARAAMGLGNLSVSDAGAGLLVSGSDILVNFATSAVAVSQAPLAANHLTQYLATGALTFTLARANTYFNGFGFWISALSDVITVAINANDSFISQSSGVSLTIPVGHRVWISTDAAASGKWSVEFAGIVLPISETPGPGSIPGGRLTLTSLTPVLTTDVTAGTTIYYTPYLHNRIPLFNGTAWFEYSFAEVSQALNDATKSPAAAAINSNYDIFGWLDGTTFRATRGPVWSSDTVRGTGAGTTEIERVSGVWLNKVTITNGPTANRGVYLGTIRTDNSGNAVWISAPAAAAGGGNCKLFVWNMYNRVGVGATSLDSTDSWTYSTATVRAADNNNSNRISFVRGLNEDGVSAAYNAIARNSTNGGVLAVGVGIDSTSAFSGSIANGSGWGGSGINVERTMTGTYTGLIGLGFHYVQALEYASGATGTFYGDNGTPLITQMSLIATTRM